MKEVAGLLNNEQQEEVRLQAMFLGETNRDFYDIASTVNMPERTVHQRKQRQPSTPRGCTPQGQSPAVNGRTTSFGSRRVSSHYLIEDLP